MSATAACGGGGMDGDDDKKRKREMPQDAPDLFSDDESAPTDKKQKSKPSFSLTKFGITRTRELAKKRRIELHKLLKARKELAEAQRVEEEASKRSFLQEIAKKRRTEHRNFQKALTEIAEAEGVVAAARDRLAVLFDQNADEGNQEEEVDGEDKKATEEEEEEEASSSGKGKASGYQSDHSMAEAGLSDDNADDDMVHDSKTDEDNGGK